MEIWILIILLIKSDLHLDFDPPPPNSQNLHHPHPYPITYGVSMHVDILYSIELKFYDDFAISKTLVYGDFTLVYMRLDWDIISGSISIFWKLNYSHPFLSERQISNAFFLGSLTFNLAFLRSISSNFITDIYLIPRTKICSTESGDNFLKHISSK